MFRPQVGDIVLHKLKGFPLRPCRITGFSEDEKEHPELDLWRILEYSGHLIILLFKGQGHLNFAKHLKGEEGPF